MGLLSKPESPEKEALLKKIHRYPEVKNTYLICQTFDFISWIISTIIFIIFAISVWQYDKSGLVEINVLLQMFLIENNLYIILIAYGVFVFLYSLIKSHFKKKLDELETNAERDIKVNGEKEVAPSKTDWLVSFHEKRKKPQSFISMIITIITILGVASFMPNCSTSKNDDALSRYLNTPSEISYNVDEGVLTWSKVDNAESYAIDYNGVSYTSTENKLAITLIATENNFKVKAIANGDTYFDSTWSEVYTYTVQQTELSTYQKVYIKLNEFVKTKNYNLLKIATINYASVTLNPEGYNLSFTTLCESGGSYRSMVVKLKVDGCSTVSELFENINNATLVGNITLNYAETNNSAQKLIDSNSFYAGGDLENLRNLGYNISVVSAVTLTGWEHEDTQFRFEIHGTYKAVKGETTLYFTVKNYVYVLNKSTDVEDVANLYHYETAVASPSARNLYEIGFVLYEDEGLINFVKELEANA